MKHVWCTHKYKAVGASEGRTRHDRLVQVGVERHLLHVVALAHLHKRLPRRIRTVEHLCVFALSHQLITVSICSNFSVGLLYGMKRLHLKKVLRIAKAEESGHRPTPPGTGRKCEAEGLVGSIIMAERPCKAHLLKARSMHNACASNGHEPHIRVKGIFGRTGQARQRWGESVPSEGCRALCRSSSTCDPTCPGIPAGPAPRPSSYLRGSIRACKIGSATLFNSMYAKGRAQNAATNDIL